MQYRKGEWRALCFFVPLLAMTWLKSPRSAFHSKDLPRINSANAFRLHIQTNVVQGWSLSVIGVRRQSQYCRVSTLLESVQYVLETQLILASSVLITPSYFTDSLIYTTIYKYIFPKYFLPHCRPFFSPSVATRTFIGKLGNWLRLLRNPSLERKKVVLMPRLGIYFLWKMENK